MQRRRCYGINNPGYVPYMPQNPYMTGQMPTMKEEKMENCKNETIKEMPVIKPTMGCGKTTFYECPPIYTCSKNVVDEYHITKQPYIHNYHTEVVHHYITENEYIPTYTQSEVHMNNNCCIR